MAQIVGPTMSRHDDARSLLRAVCSTEVDLIPDQGAKTLTVRLRQLANTSSDEALKHLCGEINATETQLPGTELRLTIGLGAKSLKLHEMRRSESGIDKQCPVTGADYINQFGRT